jgi:hypothetical protein
MKCRHLIYPFIGLLVVLASCTGGDKKANENTTTEDSVVTNIIDTSFAAETIDTFNTTGFSTYAKQHAQAFDWTKFRMTSTWTDSSMITASFHPDKRYFEAYGRFLKYSPDSNYFLDLDSYNVDIRKTKNGKLVGTEVGPDTEVSLVNPKTGKKTRLLFLGPGNSIEDGLWLNNENLVLMGVQDANNDSTAKNGSKTAAVWRFNVPTKTFYLYELHDSGTAKQIMGYWRKERLKGVLTQ